ncbi:M24 family metallopeptidase [Aliiruegeria lutimaris]|uniref:Metallopeptidase family M24 n=1 Tax=Aliiruegeria lutimaris TaxID=571298 RepID=A0A1G8SPU9_9RHOB|nr:M24 family metallopeptidase [Aliiruegeria lutimaris]SDJ30775.1 Metallopeptidase family M24 [Aliiruegeria lutimaris]
MTSAILVGHQLEEAFCRRRQEALRETLRSAGCAALLVADRGQLCRLFNYWARDVFPALGLIQADGPAVLCCMTPGDSTPFADEVRAFEGAQMSSLRPQLRDLALDQLRDLLPRGGRLGVEGNLPLALWEQVEPVDMRMDIDRLSRAKDRDEIALIAAGAAAGESAFAAIEPLLVDGTREIDLFAAYQAAAVAAAGQPIGELGNDFRGCAMGGAPRTAPLRAGDLVPIDTGVMIRGYYSDLCRTYPVSGVWAPAQRDAARRVAQAHDLALSMIAPGVSCRSVYQEVSRFLDGYRGWSFGTHLGHGIGLRPVETPRINPHWDDRFAAGDVFTLEPGLYDAELRAGVRIENDYVLSDTGVEALSDSCSVVPA